MQSSLLMEYIGFFISKSVFQCELHLILNSSFLTRIIALYQNLKAYFYRVGIP
jgi:hypothetical protein